MAIDDSRADRACKAAKAGKHGSDGGGNGSWLVCRSCGALVPDDEKQFKKHCRRFCPTWLYDRQQPPSQAVVSHRQFDPNTFKYYCHLCPANFSGRGRFDGCFNNVYDQVRHEWKKHKFYLDGKAPPPAPAPEFNDQEEPRETKQEKLPSRRSRGAAATPISATEYDPQSPPWDPDSGMQPYDPFRKDNEMDEDNDGESDSDADDRGDGSQHTQHRLSESSGEDERDDIRGLLWTPRLWIPTKTVIKPCPPRPPPSPEESFSRPNPSVARRRTQSAM